MGIYFELTRFCVPIDKTAEIISPIEIARVTNQRAASEMTFNDIQSASIAPAAAHGE
jgi:hypothetical protein